MELYSRRDIDVGTGFWHDIVSEIFRKPEKELGNTFGIGQNYHRIYEK